MGLGESIELGLRAYRRWRTARLGGPFGDFQRAGGQELLLRGMQLQSDDLVIDVGGYVGDWAADVICRFGCRAIVFEPMPAAQEALRKRFGHNQRVTLVNAGLSSTDRELSMSVEGNGSSAFRTHGDKRTQTVKVRDVEAAFEELGVGEIGCLKLNIEGGEFDVLEKMSTTGLMQGVRYLLVQFHDVAADSRRRRDALQLELARSFTKDFDYPFVWERWHRRVT